MLSLRFALRYLLSRKSHGAVNIISAISVGAVAVAAAAMIIVLSVFNGFRQLAESKLSNLDPDFMLTPVEGKSFGNVAEALEAVRKVQGVGSAQPEITGQAFAVAGDMRMGVIMKGMTAEGIAASGIASRVIDGTATILPADTLCEGPSPSSALLSVGAAMSLNLRPQPGLELFELYEPRREGRINPANPLGAFRTAQMMAQGVYQIEQEEYDKNMVIVPYATAATLLGYTDRATSIAVQAAKGMCNADLRRALTEAAAPLGLQVLDRYEQQPQAFRMIAVEKWITFLMLTFILIIASFNILSSLSMMMLEKEPNMAILTAMGAGRGLINRIFVSQGWLIVMLGGAAGMALGSAAVLCQQKYGWVKLSASNPSMMTVDTYPVLLTPSDLLVAAGAVTAVALLITPVIVLLRSRR